MKGLGGLSGLLGLLGLSGLTWVAVVAVSFTATPALGGPARFSGQLTVVQGDGSGHVSVRASSSAAGSLGLTSGPTLALPASAFQGQQTLTYTVSGGIVQTGAAGDPITSRGAGVACTIDPNCTVVFGGQVTGQVTTSVNSRAGAFAPGQGLAGGFGGALSLGTSAVVREYVEIGLWVPLTVTLPLGVIGAGGMTTQTLTIHGSYLGKIIVTGFKWTTGMITVVGGASGSNFTGGGFKNFATSSVIGQTETARLALVTPFIVTITGVQPERRVGYASLYLQVPEPGSLLLLATGIVGLVAVKRRRKNP